MFVPFIFWNKWKIKTKGKPANPRFTWQTSVVKTEEADPW